MKNQRVLVILAHGKGGAPPDPFQQAFQQSLRMENAGRYWREVSYGKTTFKFQMTDGWLELPRPIFGSGVADDGYVWGRMDIEWARRELLQATKRHAAVVGTSLWAVHQGFRLSDVNIANPAQPVEQSTLSNLGTPFHVAISGQIAYVASGINGVYVVNLAAAGGPAVIGHLLGLVGRPVCCDVDGNLLAVAALEGGLYIYDISTPATPNLLGAMAGRRHPFDTSSAKRHDLTA